MLSFRIMDDLKEARAVLDQFISLPDTEEKIHRAIEIMSTAIMQGGKIISAGNGGSMCDALHFAEELTGCYRRTRRSLPAVAICDPSHLTCAGNDYGYDSIFSRYLEGMGFKGDVFLGISTSGNSGNIVEALRVCREKGLKSVCLLGKNGGKIRDLCDLPIIVPHQGFSDRIQEVHTMIIHIMIRGIESEVCGI